MMGFCAFLIMKIGLSVIVGMPKTTIFSNIGIDPWVIMFNGIPVIGSPKI
jgi:hypothetical protein